MPSRQPAHLIDPTGRNHPLTSDITHIGRAVECDIVITSQRVSREHAAIERQGWRLFVADSGSTNGTFLNGERLAEPRQLRDGDQIQVGDVIFTFRDPDVTSADGALPTLEVDENAGIIRLDRHELPLAPKEYSLLLYLHQRQGEVCSKDEIGAAVWPEYAEGGVYDYQIENLVRRLRAKIEPDAANPQLLVTIRGRGYKLILYR